MSACWRAPTGPLWPRLSARRSAATRAKSSRRSTTSRCEAGHGTLTALVGPDGAGKTTLLRLVAGLMLADAGGLQVLGIDVAADPQEVQDRIGYMPQRFGLYEDLSVQENLEPLRRPARRHGRRSGGSATRGSWR